MKLGPKLAGNIFLFRATVTGTADNPLTGEVILLLHPTYSRPAVSLTADTSSHPAGVTNYEFPASGSFTLIAMADEGRTILSFDLAKLPGLPPTW